MYVLKTSRPPCDRNEREQWGAEGSKGVQEQQQRQASGVGNGGVCTRKRAIRLRKELRQLALAALAAIQGGMAAWSPVSDKKGS